MVPPECWRMPRKRYADVKSSPIVNVRRLAGAVASVRWRRRRRGSRRGGAADGPAAVCARAGVAKSPATHTPNTNPRYRSHAPSLTVVSGCCRLDRTDGPDSGHQADTTETSMLRTRASWTPAPSGRAAQGAGAAFTRFSGARSSIRRNPKATRPDRTWRTILSMTQRVWQHFCSVGCLPIMDRTPEGNSTALDCARRNVRFGGWSARSDNFDSNFGVVRQ